MMKELERGNGFHQMITLPACKSYRIKGNENSFVDVDDLKSIYSSSYVQIAPNFIDIEAPTKPEKSQSSCYEIHLKGNNEFSQWRIPIHARYPPFASTHERVVQVELAEICLFGDDDVDESASKPLECQKISTIIPHGIEKDARLANYVTFVVVCAAFLIVIVQLVMMRKRKENLTISKKNEKNKQK